MKPDVHGFSELYARDEDPWKVRTRWYETRKRALALACLPAPHYGATLELGCSNGELSAALAERSTVLVACDVCPAALEYARNRLASLPATAARTTFECVRVPDEWPRGSFDLVVLSEIAYYLGPDELTRTLHLMEEAFNAGATVLACHWRHPIAGCVMDGDAVHERLKDWGARSGTPLLAEHVEADFNLGVWCRDPRSVAAREGLV